MIYETSTKDGGETTSLTGAPVDSYGVEFYDDEDDVVCVDLLDGRSTWTMRNIGTGEVITSEDGKAQVKSEDDVSAMMKVVSEIVAGILVRLDSTASR